MLRIRIAEERCAHAAELASLRQELEQGRQHAVQVVALERALAEDQRARKQHAALQQRAAALAARAEVLEQSSDTHSRRAAQFEIELRQARAALAAIGPFATATPSCEGDCPPGSALEGRCVLCVGGRTGLVDGYRRIVEQQGGRFLHHDGGQEESLQRIDAAIANADAVVCQTGCISHAAYWRLKEACKKQGKTCIFVPSTGVGSFARSLSALAGATAGQVIRLSA
jgi:hypothetical protein